MDKKETNIVLKILKILSSFDSNFGFWDKQIDWRVNLDNAGHIYF